MICLYILHILCAYDDYCLFTIFSFKVSKAELRALVGDYDLSIQGEYHGFVLHVDHAAHHISFSPRPPKEMTAHMNPAALGAIFRKIMYHRLSTKTILAR